MIDIHAHILPGIDDGAEDMYDTLEMARMAADSGVDKIIATPHCVSSSTMISITRSSIIIPIVWKISSNWMIMISGLL